MTQLIENRLLVIAVGPTIYQTRCTTDIAMIFLRSLDYFGIPGVVFHFFDSSIDNLTALI